MDEVIAMGELSEDMAEALHPFAQRVADIAKASGLDFMEILHETLRQVEQRFSPDAQEWRAGRRYP